MLRNRVGAAFGAVLLLLLPTPARTQDPGVFYPGVYYPNSPDPAGAVPFDLAPGQESAPLVFALRPTGGTVRVRALDSEDGAPIAGILVEVLSGGLSRFARTGTDGVALTPSVPAGPVRLRVRPDDPRSETGAFAVRYAPGVIDPDEATTLQLADSASVDFGDLRLPRAGRIKLTVLRPSGGAPWSGAPVVLRSAAGDFRRFLRTDDQGRVSFGALEPGDYLLWADLVGTEGITQSWDGSRDTLASTPIPVARGTLERLELRPDLGGQITGAVRDRSSNFGLPDLEVRILPTADPSRPFSFRTDELGFYRAIGLPAGGYKVFVPAIRRYFPDEMLEQNARIVQVVEPELETGIDLRGTLDADCMLPPGAAGGIGGTVEADFAFLERARIVAWDETDTAAVWIDAPGAYRLGCLEAGTYRVAIEPDGAYRTQFHPKTNDPDAAVPVSVSAGDTTFAIDFEPDRAVSLSGTVVSDPDGFPLPGITVRGFLEATSLEAAAVTDETGTFALKSLPDGTGLPAGRWIVRTDSIAISQVPVTPVLEVGLRIIGTPDLREVVFLFPPGLRLVDWVLEGRRGAGEVLSVSDASRHGDGLGAQVVRDATPGILAYRLTARFESGGAGWDLASAWHEVQEVKAPAVRIAPQPWSGRTLLMLPHGVRRDAWIDVWDLRGTRIARWRAHDSGTGLAPEAARGLPAGIYFLRWRDANGRERRAQVVLVR
jgi:hypothetical protein